MTLELGLGLRLGLSKSVSTVRNCKTGLDSLEINVARK